MRKKVIHKKTGKEYTILDDNIINCTNANDQERMVLYVNNDDISRLFVRKYEEFLEKFEV